VGAAVAVAGAGAMVYSKMTKSSESDDEPVKNNSNNSKCQEPCAFLDDFITS